MKPILLSYHLRKVSLQILILGPTFVNTQKGLLYNTKLSFEIKPVSLVFQQKKNNILKEFKFFDCYIDDLFVHAHTKESLDQALNKSSINCIH